MGAVAHKFRHAAFRRDSAQKWGGPLGNDVEFKASENGESQPGTFLAPPIVPCRAKLSGEALFTSPLSVVSHASLMGLRYAVAVLGCLACRTAGHGILRDPIPRVGTANGNGAKLTGTSKGGVNCGGLDNGDPGYEAIRNQPKTAYRVGANVAVQWQLTIPHPLDNLNSGVRIALHFNDGDSFNNNVRARAPVELARRAQCPLSDIRAPWQVLLDNVDASQLTRLITLPEGRLCTNCVLQWIWEAKEDGGIYAQCVDIAITDTGTPASLPPCRHSLPRSSDPCAVIGGCRPAA